MSDTSQQILCTISAARWGLFRFQAGFRPSLGVTPGISLWALRGRRLFLAQSRILLRKLLRRSPSWSAGHLYLGVVELFLAEFAGKDPRSVAAATISAEAVLKLASNSERDRRLKLQAQVLLGKIALLQGDSEKAAALLEEVVLERERFSTEPQVIYLALEDLGGALLALGRYDESAHALRSIPEEQQSNEVRTAVAYLKGRI